MELLHKIRIYGLKQSFFFVFNELYLKCWRQLILKSYSQNGEDMIVDRMLKSKKKGFYVDVGAYDPVRYSNTKRFYDRGWKGINIEPDKQNITKFKKQRKRDVNLNIGIGKKSEKITFYQFTPNTLSTFSKKEADHYVKEGYALNNKSKIPIQPLSKVLNKYVKGKKIDFMTIDTEGLDLEVLQSNNWKKYRPRLICIETASHSMDPKKSKHISAIDIYLGDQKYKKEYDNGLNSIFSDAQKK